MQNRQFETKATVEAGILSALILILMLTTAYVPFFSFLNILLPVPITVLYLRYNYKVSLGAVAVSGILVAIFYDPISSLGTSISYGLTGLTLGYCIKKEIKAAKTICFMALASGIGLICNFLLLTFLATPDGFNGFVKMLNSTINRFNETMAYMKDFYFKLGINEKQREMLNQAMQPITMEMIKSILLASFTIASFGSAIINYFTARAILKKLRYKLVEVKPFSELYISEKVGFAIAVLALLAMGLQGSKIALGKYLIVSVIYIITIVFVIEGLAVATYFLKNKFKLPKVVIVLIIIFTIMQFQFFYVIIGVVDMIMDFRKVNPNRLFKK